MFIWKLFCVAALLLTSITLALDSPCPELFRYDPLPDAGAKQNGGQWTGTVTLKSDYELHGIWVRLIFDEKLSKLSVGDSFGEVVPSKDGKEYLIKNKDVLLKENTPTDVKITVKYEGSKVPELISYRLNAKVVCPEMNTRPDDFFPGDLNSKNFLNSLISTIQFTDYVEPTSCGTAPLQQQSTDLESQWPWQAYLAITSGDHEDYLCGATLISPKHLLTAAHCVTYKHTQIPVPSQKLVVYLGQQDLNKADNAQKLGVGTITIYPGYQSKNLLNDLAVVELEKAATITDYVRPICLGDPAKPLIKGGLVGYGFTEGSRTNKLDVVEVDVIDGEECAKRDPRLRLLIGDNSICASYTEDEKDCVGDSGSALVATRSNPLPTWEIRGIVSVGPQLQDKFVCHKSGNVLLVNVAKYVKWIQALVR